MNKMLKKKISNVLRTEAQRTMENEKDINIKLEKMNDIFNLQKIIESYDELEPLLIEFFNKKAYKEKWR